MNKYVITLQNRDSGENFKVVAIGRHGESIANVHQRVMEKHAGCFIRKSIRKS